MNNKKTFWQWFTHHYLVVFRDEENFEKLRTIRFTFAKIVVILAAFAFLIFIPSFFLAKTIANYQISTSENPQARLFKLMEKSDSLESIVEGQHSYYENIRQILGGDIPQDEISEDSASVIVNSDDLDLEQIDSIDLAFRKQFEKEDSKTNGLRTSKSELQQVLFFSPISGIVTNKYNSASSHFGVDVVAPKNEVIKAAADGTVILSSWTQDSGNTLAIQHKHQLVSFYKHNSVLLKKVGETVKAGDPVAVIGNSGELTDGPHLHFELWYEGNPVNPQDFISF
ncbi:metalloendopeptidase-like membrane protein [Bernardetia litoralis DSM 6794]|uniref:Metalloendopeptidase-like membrane protein n=1 Tax=Bernardetia litoralis (strain ATCC 23117 / DSM 6794 / NBRC 15988 / NCIMB 1366 / Fx l1 / Sio-4) TaxID=880071 RepID=I4AGV9_BERLS|nr:M23 family metallopeptidase [Bernardetia litoralis]AFM03194.1 metalloendopeptidase-like membrane protein [Bernardetia litoralis DSM 6794]